MNKLNIKGTYLNIMKITYDKPTTKNILNNKQFKAFTVRSEIR